MEASGVDWTKVILGAMATMQAVAIVVIPLMIQRGRKEQGVTAVQTKSIEAKLDTNNTTTDTIHTIVNSRYDALVAELAQKQAEIDRLKTPAAP